MGAPVVMTTPPNVPDGAIVIPPSKVYEEVQALTREVRDLITADKAEQRDRARLETKVDSIETRVTAIERKVWIITGAAATAGGAIGSVLVPFLR